jgi:hypothetical protein
MVVAVGTTNESRRWIALERPTTREEIKMALGLLPPRRNQPDVSVDRQIATILWLRYGAERPATYIQIGRAYRVTRERIRQVIRRSLRDLARHGALSALDSHTRLHAAIEREIAASS